MNDLRFQFDLQISNRSGTDHDPHQWTFRSGLGELRRIDSILCSSCLICTNAYASRDIDIGSDHRVIQVDIQIQYGRQLLRRPVSQLKGWKSETDENVANDCIE